MSSLVAVSFLGPSLPVWPESDNLINSKIKLTLLNNNQIDILKHMLAETVPERQNTNTYARLAHDVLEVVGARGTEGAVREPVAPLVLTRDVDRHFALARELGVEVVKDDTVHVGGVDVWLV